MLRYMFTDTFVACSMEFLCMFVMDPLISNQNKIFFWSINMSILALGITHRCFGLQNYFTEDHKSKSNGLLTMLLVVFINFFNIFIMRALKNVDFREFKEVSKIINELKSKD